MKNLLVYFSVTPKDSFLLVKLVIKQPETPPIFRTYKVDSTAYVTIRELVVRACRSVPGSCHIGTAQVALPLPLTAGAHE